jgi:hypothetical protein
MNRFTHLFLRVNGLAGMPTMQHAAMLGIGTIHMHFKIILPNCLTILKLLTFGKILVIKFLTSIFSNFSTHIFRFTFMAHFCKSSCDSTECNTS